MPADLPTTAVGLIAFIVAGAAYLMIRMMNESKKAQAEQLATFMTYIEKKNGNLERATAQYIEHSNQQQSQFEKTLADHDERHIQMMDDAVARLESATLAKKR